MQIQISNGSTWITPSSIQISDGGVWKTVTAGYISDGVNWKQFYGAIAPPPPPPIVPPPVSPPPLPGLTPTFTLLSQSGDGFVFAVNNYDATYSWTVSTPTVGFTVPSVVLITTNNQPITVSGLSPGPQTSSVTVLTNKTGYSTGTGTFTSSSLAMSVSGTATGPTTFNISILNNPGATAYYRAIFSPSGPVPAAPTTFASNPQGFTGATASTTYSFTVTAYDSSGVSLSSASGSVTTTAVGPVSPPVSPPPIVPPPVSPPPVSPPPPVTPPVFPSGPAKPIVKP